MFKWVIYLAFIGGLSALLSTWSGQPNNQQANCPQLPVEQPAQLPTKVKSADCNHNHREPSWSSWLTGQSRSTQFHYLDLVELLFGKQAEQHTQQNSSATL